MIGRVKELKFAKKKKFIILNKLEIMNYQNNIIKIPSKNLLIFLGLIFSNKLIIIKSHTEKKFIFFIF